MVNELTGLTVSMVKYYKPLIDQRLRAWLLTFALALAGVAVASPAFARTVFDGAWSVLIVTHGGACDTAYRYEVRITDGTVISDAGGPATVQGRVTPTGAVKVTVQAVNQRADGSGRLNGDRGRGAWSGQGTSGTCSGTWEAERRE
jgi:hypothetical protein